MKSSTVAAIIVCLVVLVGAGYYVLMPTTEVIETEETTLSELPSPDTEVIQEETVTTIAEGQTYQDPQGTFSFSYPSDFTLDTEDPVHPRIYKRGPSQRSQSEMSDGVLMVYEVINLEGKSVEEWLDTYISQTTADGTLKVVDAKQATTVAGYPGFTYSTRGLGVSTNIVLQKSATSDTAVLITYAVFDPENKNYQSEVNSILSTLLID